MAESQKDNNNKEELFPTEVDTKEPSKPKAPINKSDQGLAKDVSPKALDSDRQQSLNIESEVETNNQGKKTKKGQEASSVENLVPDYKVLELETKKQRNEYWDRLLTQHPKSLLDKSTKYIDKVNNSYQQSISQNKIVISKEQKDIEGIVSASKPNRIDEETRKGHLKEYIKKKADLEERLKELQTTIGDIKPDDIVANPRTSVRDRNIKEVSPASIDTADLVKRLARERKENEERRLKAIKEREERLAKLEAEDKLRREEEKRDRDERRRVEVMKERDEILKRNEKWKEDIKAWEQQWEKKVASLPRLTGVERNKLDEAKQQEEAQRMAKLREMYRPMDGREILDWDKKYMEEREMKRKLREKDFKERQEREPTYVKKPDYESRFHKQFEEETAKIKEMEREKLLKAKEAHEKRWKYADTVKEQYFPRIDEALRVEMKHKIDKVKGRFQRSSSPSLDHQEKSPREIGKQYLEEAKQKGAKKPVSEIARSLGDKSEKNTRITNNNTRASEFINRNVLQNSESTAGPLVDDSASIRKRPDHMSEIRNQLGLKKDVNDWQKIAVKQGLAEKDKRALIKIQAERLEAAAREKERVLKINKRGGPPIEPDKEDDLDAMYIASIKAKLALLQDDPLGKQFEGVTPPKPLKGGAKKKKDNNSIHSPANQNEGHEIVDGDSLERKDDFVGGQPTNNATILPVGRQDTSNGNYINPEPSKPQPPQNIKADPKVSGTIVIYVIKAEGHTSLNRKPFDSYVTLTWAGRQIGKTKQVKDGAIAEWQEKFNIEITNQEKSKLPSLRLELSDSDPASKNTLRGSSSIDIRECLDKPKQWGIATTVPITGPQGERTGGRITVLIGFISSGQEVKFPDPDYQVDGKFYVKIKGGNPLPDDNGKTFQATVRLSVLGKIIGETKPQSNKNTNWDETISFPYYSIDTWTPNVRAEIMNGDRCISAVEVPLGQCVEEPETNISQNDLGLGDPINGNTRDNLGKLTLQLAYVPSGGPAFQFPK